MKLFGLRIIDDAEPHAFDIDAWVAIYISKKFKSLRVCFTLPRKHINTHISPIDYSVRTEYGYTKVVFLLKKFDKDKFCKVIHTTVFCPVNSEIK